MVATLVVLVLVSWSFPSRSGSVELTDGFWGGILDGEPLEKQKVTQPMANRLKLLGITYFIGKIKFKLLFHGPLAE